MLAFSYVLVMEIQRSSPWTMLDPKFRVAVVLIAGDSVGQMALALLKQSLALILTRIKTVFMLLYMHTVTLEMERLHLKT